MAAGETQSMPVRPVTMAEIAKQCGVGYSTVQRALSGQTNVLPETAARIRQVAAELGYDPANQEAARRLAYSQRGKRSTNYVIAHFMPTYSGDPYFNRVSEGILEVLTQERYALLLISCQDEHSADDVPPSIAYGHVDGAIFNNIHPQGSPHLFRLLQDTPAFRGRPMLTLFVPSNICPSVLIDESGGAYAATAHLLELGHRRIVEFWGGYMDPIYFSSQRSEGSRRACVDAGLDPAAVLCSPPINRFTWPDVRHIAPLLQALEADPTITGILAPNDNEALEMIRVLRTRGYRIPEEISIVGFDDTRRWDNDMGINQLTTIHVPLEEIGRLAAEQILARVQEPDTREYFMTLPTRLIVRGSTAPPR